MVRAQFTRPPVREVSLTVLWEPLEGLLAADVGDLLGKLRDAYPTISERTAMVPWTEIRVPGIQILAEDKVLPYSWWMSNEDDDRLVRFQFDRLVFSWRYTPDGQPYPEYNAMKHEFVSLLGIVNSWLTGKQPEISLDSHVRRVQIDYINQVDLAPIDLLCGVLTDWSGERGSKLPAQSPVLNATWFVDIDPSDLNETTVKIEFDGLNGSILTIVSTTERDQRESHLDSLDRVHDRSAEVFLSITSNHLQQKWGRRQ